jgi:hypothetical protein
MDDNLSILLIMALSVNAAVILTVLTTWIRGSQRIAGAKMLAEANGTVALLGSENQRLREQIERLEQLQGRVQSEPQIEDQR